MDVPHAHGSWHRPPHATNRGSNPAPITASIDRETWYHRLERDLLALPAQHGGLGIVDPTNTANNQFKACTEVTAPIVELICQRNPNYPEPSQIEQRKLKVAHPTKNRRATTKEVELLKPKLPRTRQRAMENGAMPSIRHNPVRDITAQLLTEVCPKVGVERTFKPLNGESFPFRSTNTEDGARLDIKPQKFGTKANNQHSLMSEYSIPLQPQIVHPPLTHATEGTNVRRGEHTNSVSLRWIMVPLLLWSCPQVEVGILSPRWPSSDSQVSSPRNTANSTATPSTSSDVRSPSA